jgi:cellulose synthase (UDP-forming)
MVDRTLRSEAEFLRPGAAGKLAMVAALVLTAVYFAMLTFAFPVGNPALFYLLILGEVFHVFQVSTYIWTVWDTSHVAPMDERHTPPVDVFITVCGEEEDVVAETVRAAVAMDYPDFAVHVLNDGYVAKKENWEAIERAARSLGASCVTRRAPGGAKAGNINNGLRETGGEGGRPIVVVFDADHVPHRDFLRRTIPHFADPSVGFVQAPQYYKNYRENLVTRSSWEQQQLFFGPICRGKNRMNAATMCGTNMAIRRDALLAVGGVAEESIAEDFLTGMRIHQRGMKSVYVPEILAEGLAPEDYLAYAKQQFRWARGALDVLFGRGLFTSPGLTWQQRLQYLSSVSFYFSGLVVAMNALIPVVYFFTGAVPVVVSTMSLAAVFLPYIFLTLFVLQRSSNDTFTFRALAFSMGSFAIHIKAVWAAATGARSAFEVTPKKKQAGNFVSLVYPHIAYALLVAVGVGVALVRDGASASLIANLAWAGLNIAVFAPSVRAALPERAPAAARPAAAAETR